MRTGVFLACLFVAVAALEAQERTLPREFVLTANVLKERPAFVKTVVVPEASCAAVNEAGTLLAIGRRAKDEKHVVLIRLDAHGQPAAEPAWITLPKPKPLAEKLNYALGVMFHPRLPVLYVWQDIPGPPPAKQENNPEFKDYLEFDHLQVYTVAGGKPELVHAGARGAGFHCGLNHGTVGLDREGRTLFLPNATGETFETGSIGLPALDEEGLPVETPDAQPAPPGASRVKAKAPRGAERRPALPRKLQTRTRFPTGAGWFAGTEAMLMGGYSGCMISDLHNGAMRQTWFPITERAGPCTLAAHPTAPAAYLALQDEALFFAMGQVNGFLTLLPQVATVTGAHYTGLPVVLTAHARVAIGDARALHLFGLKPDGKLDGKHEMLKLSAAAVKGTAYSAKHSLLYVAVDKAD